jgi:hypothetical protein
MQIAAEGGQSIEVLKGQLSSALSLPLCVCFSTRVATVHFIYLHGQCIMQ